MYWSSDYWEEGCHNAKCIHIVWLLRRRLPYIHERLTTIRRRLPHVYIHDRLTAEKKVATMPHVYVSSDCWEEGCHMYTYRLTAEKKVATCTYTWSSDSLKWLPTKLKLLCRFIYVKFVLVVRSTILDTNDNSGILEATVYSTLLLTHNGNRMQYTTVYGGW